MPRKQSWTTSQLRIAARSSSSVRQVIKKLGLIPAGGNYTQVQVALETRLIDVTHFKGRGWSKDKKIDFSPRIPLDAILVKGSSFQSYKLKRRLFRVGLKKEKCELCGWAEKSCDGRIPVELDHINGDHYDNRIENLRILCPNCHSLQLTHRGRNQKRRGGGMVDTRHLKCREL